MGCFCFCLQSRYLPCNKIPGLIIAMLAVKQHDTEGTVLQIQELNTFLKFSQPRNGLLLSSGTQLCCSQAEASSRMEV